MKKKNWHLTKSSPKILYSFTNKKRIKFPTKPYNLPLHPKHVTALPLQFKRSNSSNSKICLRFDTLSYDYDPIFWHEADRSNLCSCASQLQLHRNRPDIPDQVARSSDCWVGQLAKSPQTQHSEMVPWRSETATETHSATHIMYAMCCHSAQYTYIHKAQECQIWHKSGV